MSSLIVPLVPQDACEHPIDRLRCDLRSPEGDPNPEHVRAIVQCLRCRALWTQHDLPESIAEKLLELLDAGHLRQCPTRDARQRSA